MTWCLKRGRLLREPGLFVLPARRHRGYSVGDISGGRTQMAARDELKSLTGLRGVAALLVVIAHYSAACAPSPEIAQSFIPFLSPVRGELGMSVFFTLSGFVIAYNYSRLPWRQTPLLSLCRFFWLRISRLYPLLILFMLILFSISEGYVKRVESNPLLSLASFSVFFGVIYPTQFAPGDILASSWNLSWSIYTEMAMYLFFSIWMIVWSRCGRLSRRLLLILMIFYVAGIGGLCWYKNVFLELTMHLPITAAPLEPSDTIRWFFYVSPWSRIVDFLWGALAAVALNQNYFCRSFYREILALCLLAAIILGGVDRIDGAHQYFEQLLIAPALAALMVGAREASPLNQLLGSRVLVGIGEVSYSLYLTHQFAPRIVFQTSDFNMGILAYAANLGLSLIFALSLAAGLHKVVEMPAQRWLRSLMWRQSRGTHPAMAVVPHETSGTARALRPVPRSDGVSPIFPLWPT
jgi:peptidoglycan/LPS O-acetylase OafA/YrhL